MPKLVYALLFLGVALCSSFLWEAASYFIDYILSLNDGGGFMADLIPDLILGGLLVLIAGALYVLVVSFFYGKIFHISQTNARLIAPVSFLIAYLVRPVVTDNYPVSDKRLYMHLVGMSVLLLCIPVYFIGKKDKKRKEVIDRALGKTDENRS